MLYVLLVAVIIIFWLVAIDRPVLKIQFDQGELKTVKGHLPPSFKHNLVEIGHKTPFDGVLKVYRKRNGMKLVFDKSIPKAIQQRIRNVFPHQGFMSNKGKKSA